MRHILTLTIALPLLTLAPPACDSPDDEAELQALDIEDDTPDIDHVDHGNIDDLTAPPRPSKVIYGVWTPLVGTQNCMDMFTQSCSGSVPSQQCEVGSVCEWTPGATCYKVLSPSSVKTMRCKK